MGAISRSVIRRRERLKKIVALITLAAMVTLILGIGYLFLARQWAIKKLQAELERLDQEEDLLQEERVTLEELLAKRFDPEYLEYLARKELGLIKRGEEKYIVVEGK